ncbi:MAG: hypothetical protein HYS22_06535 [Deltaproteobacteria bacterium]|nr:hypothetical protein [Deltaproteobacteria bacterium]
MTLTGVPWKPKRPEVTAEIKTSLSNQKGAMPSFLMVVTSFVLGIFIAGLVVLAYNGFQHLLAGYQQKLEESSRSLGELTSQTSEILQQVNVALEENQRKIEELEQLKSEMVKTPEPKPVEQPKKVNIEKPKNVEASLSKISKGVVLPKDPLDEEVERLTSHGMPEDYGRRSRLIELYKRKAERNPTDAHSLLMVGRLSQQVGDYAQATRYLEKVLEKSGDNQEVVARLADIYNDWKMPEKAEYYKQKLAGRDIKD